jgi:hypothetical protein
MTFGPAAKREESNDGEDEDCSNDDDGFFHILGCWLFLILIKD